MGKGALEGSRGNVSIWSRRMEMSSCIKKKKHDHAFAVKFTKPFVLQENLTWLSDSRHRCRSNRNYRA